MMTFSKEMEGSMTKQDSMGSILTKNNNHLVPNLEIDKELEVLPIFIKENQQFRLTTIMMLMVALSIKKNSMIGLFMSSY